MKGIVNEEVEMTNDYWRGYHEGLSQQPIQYGPCATEIVALIVGAIIGFTLGGWLL